MKHAFIVGKFAPLHKGHQYLIERAIAENDLVTILSYGLPETFPVSQRMKWLIELYGNEANIAGFVDNGRDTPSLAICYKGTKVMDYAPNFDKTNGEFRVPEEDEDPVLHRELCFQAINSIVRNYRIFNGAMDYPDVVYSSELYGEPLAAYLTRRIFEHSHEVLGPIAHVEVDPERNTFPISGTMIRENIHAHKNWLDPVVYKDFVKTVVFVGAESTGKTTLAQKCAEKYGTLWVPEYGREVWIEKNGHLDHLDYQRIAHHQQRLIDEAKKDANEYLFIDTGALTTYLFCLNLIGQPTKELRDFAKRQKFDFVFYCQPDFDFVQDGYRIDKDLQNRMHGQYLSLLDWHGVRYHPLHQDIDDRIHIIKEVLDLDLRS